MYIFVTLYRVIAINLITLSVRNQAHAGIDDGAGLSSCYACAPIYFGEVENDDDDL